MEKLFFASDYQEGAHPSILKRLEETNLMKTVGDGHVHQKIAVRKLEFLTAIFYMRYIALFPALLFSRRSPKKLRNVLSIKRSRRQTKEMSAHA